MRLWLLAAVAAMFSAMPHDVAGQDSTSSTTRSGVYSAEQAARGRVIYAGKCRSCHVPETHTGPTFTAQWNGRPLSDLYWYLIERMPKNEPGSLSEQEYADVLAYMLRVLKMPTGATELPTDTLRLRAIRIETTQSP